jgi:hypothetical protein
MHKRAKERMVLTRGGIRQLGAELQDELLKFVAFGSTICNGLLTWILQERILPASVATWQICL